MTAQQVDIAQRKNKVAVHKHTGRDISEDMWVLSYK